MRSIIVIAYQLHWQRGSEYAVAWDYITHMSKNNYITVLYGTCNGHHKIGNTNEIDEFLSNNRFDNIKFVPVHPSFKSKNYSFSLIGQLLFYREYNRWHRNVAEKVSQLLNNSHYDVIHFLGPIGYREPGFLFNFPLPYIWGPMCGQTGAPLSLLKATWSLKGGSKLYIKKYLDILQRTFSFRVTKAIKQSDVVICATEEWGRIVRKKAGKKHHSVILYKPENCVKTCFPLNVEKFDDKKITLIFIGRLDSGKALGLVLEALCRIPKDSNIVLQVLGDGDLKNKYLEFARKKGLSHFINWQGFVSRTEVYNELSKSHLLLMPSLMDANTTVLWEAMSFGVPVLALDHCGFHDTIVNEVTGFLVKPDGYKKVVGSIAEVINRLLQDPSKLKELADGVLKIREQYTWNERQIFFESVYEIAEHQYENRKNGK